MYLFSVSCANCGGTQDNKEIFTYKLKVHKIGKLKRCDVCGGWEYPDEIKNDYWFCCRKCFLEFLDKRKNENFKNPFQDEGGI